MVATASISPCPLCKSAHFLNKCPQFMQKSPSQRLEIAKQHQRCVNCFSSKHAVSACPSRFSCRHCQKRHHSMLHLDSVSSATATVSASNSEAPASIKSDESPKTVALCAMSANLARPPVVLATARVSVGSLAGRQVVARALIDTGAELTLIAAHLAKKLKLRRFILPTALSAVGDLDAGIHRYAAHVKISPIDGIEPPVITTATILSSLASYSSASIQSPLQWDHLADLTLADPNSSNSDPIDLIIGADIYADIMRDGVRRGARGQPIAQETIFGWIVQGRTPLSNSSCRTVTVQHCTIAESVSLNSELRRFWEIEEIPRHTILSPEEQRCENHFLTSHSRTPAGQYVVRLPFKNGPPIDIGTSRDIAERCLKTLLRRLQANFDLKREYSDFLQEYEKLGHMRKAPESSESSQFVYIPHHPVIRDSSATTRVRVVFNASSPTSNSWSLNDHLLAGQKLQTDLAAVLLRWRQYRYVYSADVAKMYRQIRVDPRDTDYQRILWIDENTGKVQEYQLLTVTYGTTSAPFLALRVLRQLIHDDGRDFPLAVPVLQENIYVDDVLFGADEISLIRSVRKQDHGLACSKDLHPDETLKVLGISWSPSADAFQFRVVRSPSPARTKRAMLSYIARIFDPLGLSTPVTISAKILLQRLWQLRVDWDDEVPTDIAKQWEFVQSSLLELDDFHLPRWIQKGSDTVDCEIHGFSDASNYAYAAAIYIRLTSRSGNITTALLVGKSKVAPIKTLTVPRLELSAAVLMSRLMKFVIDALHVSSAPCFCWTDSTLVLAWVTQHPSKWKIFISNRVAEIQTRLPSASWRYVPTDENPADCASRGISGSQLISHHLWWQGPAWLRMPDSEWPTMSASLPDLAFQENSRATVHIANVTESWELADRYSSWPKLIRVSAYVLRFISRIQRRDEIALQSESPSSLTASEVRASRNFWVKYIQRQLFPLEIRALTQNESVPSRSPLFVLNPFLDEEQIIRVGGRLSQAPIPAQARHPIVLSPARPLTHISYSLAHSSCRNAIDPCYLTARILAAKSSKHGQINSTRVRVTPPARAFLHSELDYAGPVLIRSRSGREIASKKAYIALFVCMATRAVHLELVEGYSTPAFLGAYSHFVARRGLPESIYSDNGTTFVGADRELAAAFRATLRDPDLQNRTAADNVSWHFIPPSAPHFGGLWEAGVRSTKHHIRRVVGAHILTFEEFSTLLCNIEACLNSRPLAPFSDSLDDYTFLTPGHFLIGSALNSISDPSLLQVKENRLTRWQLVRQMTERL
ncbi:uncharacterized protein LOC113005359 [Solenopsis invicta]|uniref:uncharacterized protein LOC113005359 n=1 Tax=Solenopsis invicta TaxID=13686 RepID=UPI00193DA629|nr:uncharacterized protein LOC113005359 [Solenopsis invicta]